VVWWLLQRITPPNTATKAICVWLFILCYSSSLLWKCLGVKSLIMSVRTWRTERVVHLYDYEKLVYESPNLVHYLVFWLSFLHACNRENVMPALDGQASMGEVSTSTVTFSVLWRYSQQLHQFYAWTAIQLHCLTTEKLPSWVRTQLWLTSRPLAPYQLKSGRSAACQILDPQLTATIWRIARFSVFKSFLVIIVWWHVKKTRTEETQESSMITAYYTIPWAKIAFDLPNHE
jgi:hypothetical protein